MPSDAYAPALLPAFITPLDRFFVRTHVYAPRINPNEWRLQFDSDVNTPLTMTLEDVRRMPAVELVSVLECAGNGRGFYDPSVPGLRWGHGAVGNGRWRGVRLADVLRRAGVRATATEVLCSGADVRPRASRARPTQPTVRVCRNAISFWISPA